MTNKAYVANEFGNNVTVITEQAVQPIPLNVAITPLAANTTTSPTPTFTLNATTGFSPTAPAVTGVHYQIDTWQGPWRPATRTGATTFTATAPPLKPGVRILYAYATDAQAATSVNTGKQSSPLTGTIKAYLFLVKPAPPTAADDAFATAEDTLLSVGAPGVLGNDTTRPGPPAPSS